MVHIISVDIQKAWALSLHTVRVVGFLCMWAICNPQTFSTVSCFHCDPPSAHGWHCDPFLQRRTGQGGFAVCSVHSSHIFPQNVQTAGRASCLWECYCLVRDLSHRPTGVCLPGWQADPEWLCWSSECSVLWILLESSGFYSQLARAKPHGSGAYLDHIQNY